MSDLEGVLRRGMTSLGESWDSEIPPFDTDRRLRGVGGLGTHRRRSRRAAAAVVVLAATAMTYVVAPQWVQDWFAGSETECGTTIATDAAAVASASTATGVLQMWAAPTDGGGVTTAITFSPHGGEPSVGPAMCGANGRRLSNSSTLAVDIRDGGRRGLSTFEGRIPDTGSVQAFGYVRDDAATVVVTWRDGRSIEVPVTDGYYLAARPVEGEGSGASDAALRVSAVEAFDASGALVVRRSLPR